MEKIKVKVCQGTTCFVMGGSTVKSIIDTLTEKYPNQVEVISVRCFETCHQTDSFSKAPYVYVDDEMISEANLEKVLNKIESKLKK